MDSGVHSETLLPVLSVESSDFLFLNGVDRARYSIDGRRTML
jgi:hypothetical protein